MKKMLAAVLVLALALTATLAFADGAIKIGVIGPMTGPAADYGLACQRGAIIAAAEINAKAGETVIELLIEDDEHDAEKSVNAYHTVLDNGAQMIAGTTTTNPCIAVSAEAFSDRIFMLTPSASSTAVTADKDNMYQVCFTDPAQGTASAEYIKKNGLGTKIAVIYNNADAYSTGIYQTFEAEAKNLGIEIVAVSTFTDETTDFSVQVTAAKEAGADLVFLPIYYTPASMILQQANSMGYAPTFFGVDGMDGILTLEGFDKSLAEGVFLLTPFSADSTDDLTVNFVNAYKEKCGGEIPNQFAADAYDCVYAIAQACEAAGVTSDMTSEEICQKMVEQFTTMSFSGLTGSEMKWSANGEVTKSPKAVVIQNGVYVSVLD